MDGEPALMLDVFVASMPCPCGTGRPDQASMECNEALLELQRRHPGRIGLRVHALNLHLSRFRDTPAVAGLLREKGHEALPVVIVDGVVVFQGRINGPDDLERALAPFWSRDAG